MISKKELCQNWKLYLVTDPSGSKSRPLESTVELAIEGGADVVQLRDKNASREELAAQALRILKVTRPKGVALIINDHMEVCRQVGADGVHLGQEDASYAEARQILGEAALIGRSTHSPEQGLAAQKEGFDYIGVGPVFQTPTKPSYVPVGLDLVRFASQNIRIPFVAIGGIDGENAAQVRGAGAKTVAVVRAIMAAQDPRASAKKIYEAMK